MRTVDIKTTQNVNISFEVAPLRLRCAAFAIDLAILGGMTIAILLLSLLVFGLENVEYLMYFTVLPVMTFYTLVCEYSMNGQTFGKRAVGIRVIKLNGNALTLNDHLIRWAMRLADIWISLGGLALLLVNSTFKGQRLGDMLANTAVINNSPVLQFSLREILNIKTKENYTVTYPQVRQLSEKDMLLVKEVVQRYREHRNTAHTDALNALTQKLASQLELKSLPENPAQFLTVLINDYIVLTR